jgi:hypothetical protein
MMASGSAGENKKEQKFTQTPTKKLVLAIVELYQSEEDSTRELAAELAAAVIASYSDTDMLARTILGAYISDKVMLTGMKMNMKRIHPVESRLLSHIFGVFLFGEIL